MTSYWKTVLRSIKGSLGRFIAILMITALGVGFFAGLKVSMPSFFETGHKFVTEHALYDLRLISTIGFTDEDVEKISAISGIRAAEGAVYKDAVGFKEGVDETYVIRFHTLTNNVNTLSLEEGRYPEKTDEILVDGYSCPSDWIGKKIKLEDDDGFNYSELTITGRVRSPYYLNFQKGTSEVGSGSVDFFVYAPLDIVDHEYYTEVFIKLDSDLYIYSDEYDDNIEVQKDRIEPEVQKILDDRFGDTLDEAREDYEEGLEEYYSSLRDASKELSDGKKELDDARIEIADAQKELDDAKVELEDAKKEIDSNDKKLRDAKKTLDEAGAQLADGRKTLDENWAKLNESLAALEEANAKLPEIDSAKTQLEAGKAQLVQGIAELETGIASYKAALEVYVPQEGETPMFTAEGLAALETQKAGLETQLAEVETNLATADASIAAINEGQRLYDEGKAALESAEAEYAENKAKYDSGVSEYESGRRALSDGKKKYEDGVKEYEDGLIEFEDGVKEYNDGLIEFEEGKSEMAAQMASPSLLLAYAKGTLDNLDDPELYVLGRDTNIGYVCFENDASIVDAIAAVFPIFFFAIAALVCSTTMQRMVSDERGQIGTMRALGYTKTAIAMKYVFYSGLASLTGCVGGFFGGTWLFPYVIWSVYGMMYGFAPLTFKNDYLVFAISIVVSLLCSVGATLLTCFEEFSEEPAELIRPKAPQAGKRILLEKIPFIWKRMKFLHKVSARNVFRFKKRMWMMIFGIAGCTALVLTGFGLKDSFDNLMKFQYGEIQTYDILFSFNDPGKAKMDAYFDKADKEAGFETRRAYIEIKNIKHNSKELIRNVELFASDEADITDFINPHNEGTVYAWPSDGKVAISAKLAARNKLKAGDKIRFEYGDDGKSFELQIDYVFENYVNHYALINKATYEQVFEERFDPTSVLIKLPDDMKSEGYSYAGSVARDADLKSWQVTEETRMSFESTMEKLNEIVVLVIGCAGLLAFIVLFNLNNINITERIREIATLKVLGFNRMETGSYVFRENFILVFIGFLFGVPLGILLHRFVINQIDMDIVMYKITIFPISYVISLFTVFLFSIIVDLAMRGKIERIDMAESLKSIE